MSEEMYALDAEDVERLRALLNAWDEGRLNPRSRPLPTPLSEPIATKLVTTTTAVPAMSGGVPGTGSVQLQALVPSVVSNALQYSLQNTLVPPTATYNVSDFDVESGTQGVTVRDPISGQDILLPFIDGTIYPDINTFWQVGTSPLECWYSAGKLTDANQMYENGWAAAPWVPPAVDGEPLFAKTGTIALPIWVGPGGTIDGGGFYLYSPSSPGGKIRIGIYSAYDPFDGNLYPDALLWDSGDFAVDGSGALGANKITGMSPGIALDAGMAWAVLQLTPGGTGAPTMTTATATGSGSVYAGGTTYYYVITAITSAGETVISNQVSAAPTAGQEVVLDWSAYSGATGYKIYQSTVSGVYADGVSGGLLETVGTVTTWTDNGSTQPPDTSDVPPTQYPTIAALGTPDYCALLGWDKEFAQAAYSRTALGMTSMDGGALPGTFPGGATPIGGGLPAILFHYSA